MPERRKGHEDAGRGIFTINLITFKTRVCKRILLYRKLGHKPGKKTCLISLLARGTGKRNPSERLASGDPGGDVVTLFCAGSWNTRGTRAAV
ncbi:hypothetical protein AMELA_G00285580 [Ameiurus melas]|uniref:Uncharacterized protein n=1 Tax=Ameiurus melas TaxID=219545 RepID=A0A7J5ZIG0_AMEME|nr:hypothetical protein AMELA_G00285580 [Ameiurus melas]